MAHLPVTALAVTQRYHGGATGLVLLTDPDVTAARRAAWLGNGPTDSSPTGGQAAACGGMRGR
jgi:hypothetical protein